MHPPASCAVLAEFSASGSGFFHGLGLLLLGLGASPHFHGPPHAHHKKDAGNGSYFLDLSLGSGHLLVKIQY